MKSLLGAVCAVFLCASGAQAATVNLSTTLDTTKGTVTPTSWLYESGTSWSPFSVNLAEGDVLDWTVSFLAGQSVTLYQLNYIFPALTPAVDTVIDTGPSWHLEFLNNGTTVATLNKNDTAVSHQLIEVFSPNGPWISSPLTFNGFHILMPLADYHTAGVTTQNYSSGSISFGGQSVPPPIAGVPEPATWAMMIMGFGMVGGLMRRRRALVLT